MNNRGDPAEVTTEPEEKSGYCNHASVLFPTWHRPSVLLLEQAISEAVQSLIPERINENTKNREEWLTAAKELRFPYWDWTHPDTGKEGLPDIFFRETLELLLPQDEDPEMIGEVENILKFYHFGDQGRPAGFRNIFEKYDDPNSPDTKRAKMAYFQDWKRTYRWPSAKQHDPEEGYVQLNELRTTKLPLRGNWRELTNSVARLFCFPDPKEVIEAQHPNVWDEFSNTRFQSAKKGANEWIPGQPRWKCGSMEQVHNNVHSVLGGTGNMNDPDYASFDPIFFLHHCNVDRIIAFWEHVYPEYQVGNGKYWTYPDNKKPGHFSKQYYVKLLFVAHT
ncbi:tyrosinase tyrosinase: common central domain protein [Rhizoctonia solani 123E]|uniref:tyrosinase n=1 Tax=Rhizoctonia solani 123E TaxID=1423351 RepID=A0A074RK37_9AGAM|nr:tyrosinase tyrosinase: common central domain protein [Rhizoctonia solani 123E]